MEVRSEEERRQKHRREYIVHGDIGRMAWTLVRTSFASVNTGRVLLPLPDVNSRSLQSTSSYALFYAGGFPFMSRLPFPVASTRTTVSKSIYHTVSAKFTNMSLIITYHVTLIKNTPDTSQRPVKFTRAERYTSITTDYLDLGGNGGIRAAPSCIVSTCT